MAAGARRGKRENDYASKWRRHLPKGHHARPAAGFYSRIIPYICNREYCQFGLQAYQALFLNAF